MATPPSQRYRDKLTELILNREDMGDLLSIVNSIGISSAILQDVLCEYVDNLSPDDARKYFFRVYGIDKILPMDVMQKIQLFDHNADHQRINRSCRANYERNQSLIERAQTVVKAVNMYRFQPPLIHQKFPNVSRTSLKAKGSSGRHEYRRLPDGTKVYKCTRFRHEYLQSASNGDKFVLGEGSYRWEYPFSGKELVIDNKQLEIVGGGEDVRIYVAGETIKLTGKTKLLFKNVKLILNHGDWNGAGFKLEKHTSLWMDGCKVTHYERIFEMDTNSKVCLANCEMNGVAICSMLPGHHSGTVLAIGCIFRSHTHSIAIKGTVHCYGCCFIQGGILLTENLNIECVGNVVQRCRHCEAQREWEALNRLTVSI